MNHTDTAEFQETDLNEKLCRCGCRFQKPITTEDFGELAGMMEKLTETWWSNKVLCDGCIDEHLSDRRKTERLAEWRAICPVQFQNTDPARLERPERYEKAVNAHIWTGQNHGRGLLLYGKTGMGKTRAMWSVLLREFLRGKDITVLNSGSAFEYARMMSIGVREGMDWLQHKITVPVLGLDDIFKGKLTDSWESALFDIIDSRMENGRPFVVTCNDVGDALAARMSPDRGPALIRRLREFCERIHF